MEPTVERRRSWREPQLSAQAVRWLLRPDGPGKEPGVRRSLTARRGWRGGAVGDGGGALVGDGGNGGGALGGDGGGALGGDGGGALGGDGGDGGDGGGALGSDGGGALVHLRR